MKAAEPTRDGYTTRNGVRLHWEVYGEGELTVFLLPTWSIIHSRHWKLQIPYFARHCRVLVMDGRGNGRSDRPRDVAAYSDEEFVADAIAVMNDTGTERAALVGLSSGARWGLMIAARHPERVTHLVVIGAGVRLEPWEPLRDAVNTT